MRRTPAEPVPLHIRNAPTGLMQGPGLRARATGTPTTRPDAEVTQDHLPDALRGRTYYHPVPRGREVDIRERLERWRERRARGKEPS